MYIEIAKICGLCAGATKALNTARKEIASGKKVVLYKELLHNPLVMESLLKSARVVDNLEDVCTDEHVIIRAHGEPKITYDYLDKNGISYSYCICPNVKRIHNIVLDKDSNGYQIIIIGKHGKGKKIHPEVYGTCGWCTDPILIEDEKDIEILDSVKRPCYAVCQTTFPLDKADMLFAKIREYLDARGIQLEIENTICNGQKLINESSVELAKTVNLMIVVGGKNSSNSIELYNNVSRYTTSVFIDRIEELDAALKDVGLDTIPKDYRIGLTAGASTEKVVLEDIKNILLSREVVC